MQSTVDLHSHSRFSDGALEPNELVARAYHCGVRQFALTDHDSIDGLPLASAEAERLGLKLISGVEISSQWMQRSIHIVGLNFDTRHPALNSFLSCQKSKRWERAKNISDRLVRIGLPDLYDRVSLLSGQAAPGRPHFAQAMIEEGVVSSFDQAFKKYLGAGKAGDLSMSWPDLEEVVNVIVDSGGVAIIAHPRKYQMTLTKLRQLIVEFKAIGGGAIEVVTSGQKQGDTGLLGDLCIRYDLQGSIGSDFHSPAQSWAELGKIQSLPKSVDPVWAHWS